MMNPLGNARCPLNGSILRLTAKIPPLPGTMRAATATVFIQATCCN